MSKRRLTNNPLEWIEGGQEETGKSKGKDSRKRGLKKGWIRSSIVVKEEYLNKLKAYAWWERLSTRDVLNEALEQYFKDKEVKPIPEDRRDK